MNEPSLRSSNGGHRFLFATDQLISMAAVLLLAIGTATPLIADDLNSINDPALGPCVLLKNGNVLFGSATRLGSMLNITRADQSKISLPFDQVDAIGRSITDLYAHRVKHRFPNDLRRIQSDVRWCLRYGLIRQAATDVLAARTLDPSNAETIQLLRQIASRINPQPSNELLESHSTDPSVQQVSHESASSDSIATADPSRSDIGPNGIPNLRLSEANVHVFAAKIQPILMNRCAGCHSRDDSNPSGFQLHSALTSKWAPRIVVAENLQSLMPYIDFDSLRTSKIREKALDGHGGRRHSFGSESSIMMKHLDQWLSELTVLDTSTAWESALNDGAIGPLVPVEPPALSRMNPSSGAPSASNATNGSTENPADNTKAIAAWNDPSSSQSTMPTGETQRIRRMPKVANPFDPELFNRHYFDR